MLLACLLAMMAGCSSEDTSLRLRFVVDPTLNTEQQLLSVVQELELVLDTTSGFSGVGATGKSVGDFVSADVDGDDVAELRLTRYLSGDRSLPQIRLLPGSNLDSRFQITAKGLRQSEIAAIGGLASVDFRSGEHVDINVPFNLRASYRAPRVVISLPHDGQTVPQALGQVYIEFSKQVALSPKTEDVRLVYESTAGDRTVPGAWNLSQTKVEELGMDEIRAVATLQLEGSCPLNPGTFRIEAATSIVDGQGNPLDQDATSAELDGFVASFSIPGQAAASPCGGTPLTCKDDKQCDPAAGFVCQIPPGAQEGVCVPAFNDCSNSPCPPGWVCSVEGDKAACVQDCRLFGDCGLMGFCEMSSGICLPCGSDPSMCPKPPDCQELCKEACMSDQDKCAACLQQHNCAQPPPPPDPNA